MSDFARKVLWIVDMKTSADETRLATHASDSGANIVCIRTTNDLLPGAIKRFQSLGVKVYAWRWPAVKPPPHSAPHYYAIDEAQFVATKLIPAGLDGYIADPESDGAGQANDWNQNGLAPLAREFCAIIRNAAQTAGLADFKFGTTSGCAYPTGKPKIPWAEFTAASDALYPQTYWRWTNSNDDVEGINGGTPQKAIDRGLAAWNPIAAGKPVIPMAGEVDVLSPDEIRDYGARLKAKHIDEIHFYADNTSVSAANCAAIKGL
jgi:hypothetical protein